MVTSKLIICGTGNLNCLVYLFIFLFLFLVCVLWSTKDFEVWWSPIYLCCCCWSSQCHNLRNCALPQNNQDSVLCFPFKSFKFYLLKLSLWFILDPFVHTLWHWYTTLIFCMWSSNCSRTIFFKKMYKYVYNLLQVISWDKHTLLRNSPTKNEF